MQAQTIDHITGAAVERDTGMTGLTKWMISRGYWTAPEGVDREGISDCAGSPDRSMLSSAAIGHELVGQCNGAA